MKTNQISVALILLCVFIATVQSNDSYNNNLGEYEGEQDSEPVAMYKEGDISIPNISIPAGEEPDPFKKQQSFVLDGETNSNVREKRNLANEQPSAFSEQMYELTRHINPHPSKIGDEIEKVDAHSLPIGVQIPIQPLSNNYEFIDATPLLAESNDVASQIKTQTIIKQDHPQTEEDKHSMNYQSLQTGEEINLRNLQPAEAEGTNHIKVHKGEIHEKGQHIFGNQNLAEEHNLYSPLVAPVHPSDPVEEEYPNNKNFQSNLNYRKFKQIKEEQIQPNKITLVDSMENAQVYQIDESTSSNSRPSGKYAKKHKRGTKITIDEDIDDDGVSTIKANSKYRTHNPNKNTKGRIDMKPYASKLIPNMVQQKSKNIGTINLKERDYGGVPIFDAPKSDIHVNPEEPIRYVDNSEHHSQDHDMEIHSLDAPEQTKFNERQRPHSPNDGNSQGQDADEMGTIQTQEASPGQDHDTVIQTPQRTKPNESQTFHLSPSAKTTSGNDNSDQQHSEMPSSFSARNSQDQEATELTVNKSEEVRHTDVNKLDSYSANFGNLYNKQDDNRNESSIPDDQSDERSGPSSPVVVPSNKAQNGASDERSGPSSNEFDLMVVPSNEGQNGASNERSISTTLTKNTTGLDHNADNRALPATLSHETLRTSSNATLNHTRAIIFSSATTQSTEAIPIKQAGRNRSSTLSLEKSPSESLLISSDASTNSSTIATSLIINNKATITTDESRKPSSTLLRETSTSDSQHADSSFSIPKPTYNMNSENVQHAKKSVSSTTPKMMNQVKFLLVIVLGVFYIF